MSNVARGVAGHEEAIVSQVAHHAADRANARYSRCGMAAIDDYPEIAASGYSADIDTTRHSPFRRAAGDGAIV